MFGDSPKISAENMQVIAVCKSTLFIALNIILVDVILMARD